MSDLLKLFDLIKPSSADSGASTFGPFIIFFFVLSFQEFHLQQKQVF